MEKVTRAEKAFDVWIKENGQVVFFIQSRKLFRKIGDQKIRELGLMVSGDLLILTGPVAVIGVAAVDEKGFLPGLCQRTSATVEVVLDEDPEAKEDPEARKPREAFAMTLPVQVSLA
jgi:hypothetical protein